MRTPRILTAILIAAAVAAVSSCSGGGSGQPPGAEPTGATSSSVVPAVDPETRGLAPYRGLGTWVDVFDYHPAFQDPGERTAVTPSSVGNMAALGVRTLYLQAAREDLRTPEPIAHASLVRAFLQQAHANGVRVVAWYLPKLVDLDADMRHIDALLDYRVEGEHGVDRFDGVALDLEETTTISDAATRSNRLVELSKRADRAAGETPLGAIVLPPVAMEVVNPDYWPSYPWREIAPHYDVWMPMSYWTFRSTGSGYDDGYKYTDENVRRMLANVGDPDVPLHPIGGIGDEATAQQYLDFVRAAKEHHAIGWSIYDWATTSSAAWEHLRD